MNSRIKEYINLPNKCTVENSNELAQELHKINITENHKIVALDIKDLYVNLPKRGIIRSTIFWLERNNINKNIKLNREGSNSTKREGRPPQDGQTIVTETCRVLMMCFTNIYNNLEF